MAKGDDLVSATVPQTQRYPAFLAWKALCTHCFFCGFIVSICADALLPEPFAIRPAPAKLPFAQIVKKLGRRLWRHVLLLALVNVCGALGVAQLPVAVRQSKLDMYLLLAVCYGFVVFADAHTRHVFRTQTVSGQARTRKRHQSSKAAPSRPHGAPSVAQLARISCQDLSFVVSGLLAAAYVHIVSSLDISTQNELFVFALCSLALKLLVQELAKVYLSKLRRPPTMRIVTITVATPTVLIDTQLRTALLYQENASLTLLGSLLLATGEIMLRIVRTLYVRRSVRRIMSLPPAIVRSATASISRSSLKPVNTASLGDGNHLGQLRSRKLLALHAAEVYADMYAEYMAMGCSYAILFFFGDHPRFEIGNHSVVNVATGAYLATVVLQIGIEVVVDFVASALEIRFGVDFERFSQNDSFLALFMVTVALANIHISSGVYLLHK